MPSTNTIYIKKSDFNTHEDFTDYIATMMRMLTQVPSNIVVAYQSLDPNIYVIEVNSQDHALNASFPIWLFPDEIIRINKERNRMNVIAEEDDDIFKGYSSNNNGGTEA